MAFLEVWTTSTQIADRDSVGAESIAADLTLRTTAALEALDLQDVYTARLDADLHRSANLHLPDDVWVTCHLLQHANRITPTFPMVSWGAAISVLMHTLGVRNGRVYKGLFHGFRATDVGRYLVARRYRAGSDNGLSAGRWQNPVDDVVVVFRDDACEYTFRASPGYFNSSSFSLHRAALSPEERTEKPPIAAGEMAKGLTVTDAQEALASLQVEVNESLSDLGLPNLHVQTSAAKGSGFSEYVEIGWTILGVLGSGMAVNAAYDVAKVVVLRHLRQIPDAFGGGPNHAASRDEAVALARWCVARAYANSETDFIEAAESRDSTSWIIELLDAESRYRVTVPHGETQCSRFSLERRSLDG